MPRTEDIADNKEKKKKKDTNQLGLSPATYALGESSKWSLFSIAGITAAMSTVLLGVFREGATNWRNREPILNWLGNLKKDFDKYAKRIFKIPEQNNIFKGAGPIIALSFGISLILSHFVQLPALERGRRKARHAVDRYNMLQNENVELEKKLAEYEGQMPASGHSPGGASMMLGQSNPTPSKNFTAAETPPLNSHVGTLQQQEKDASVSAGVRTV